MNIFEESSPRQVMCVTSRAETELMGKRTVKDNVFTLTWHTPISVDPPLYGICVNKSRYSYGLIMESKVFVVNFMPHSLKDEVRFAGENSGKHIDKFKETGLKRSEAETIDCCVLSDALSHLECEVTSEIELGDHILIVGKILHSKTSPGQRSF